MNLKDNVIVIPINDAEAVLIAKLAAAIGLPIIASWQEHGATLDKEKGLLKKIQAGKYQKIFIVEMPGIKTETKLRQAGRELVIIDHHQYGTLDRAHDVKRKIKPSSLEQFLKLFNLTDKKLSALGFSPRLVRGIGILDRGFIEALGRAGYSTVEIKKVFSFRKKLNIIFVDPAKEKIYQKKARLAWQKRKEWNGFFIVTINSKFGLRAYLSELVWQRLKKSPPIILVENGRNAISVQETPIAEAFLKKFGGFVFGEGDNWGYKNQPGRKKVTLADVKKFLS
ncbi:MAG: hypothetical protein WC702_03210 [Patescibacteria group bacterium]